jgi:hypothetical protein
MKKSDVFIWGLCTGIMIILSSCNQREKETESVFSETEKQLNGTVLIEEKELLDPWTIRVMDSLLVVGNSNGLPLIEIYNRFSKKLLCSFLTKGEGPLEVLALSQLQNNGKKLFISDLFSRRMLSVDKGGIDKGEVTVEPFFNLNGCSDEIIEVVKKNAYLNEKYNIVSTADNRGRLGLINRKDKTMSFFYPFTESEVLFSELSSYINNDLFSFDMTVCSQNNRVALSTHMADILDIFEYKEDKLLSVWHHQTFLPNGIKILTFENTFPQAFYTQKSKIGYFDITSSNKNVYALFGGASEEEGVHFYANRIRVFDWNGENRFEIRTDYPLKRIAVDAEDRFIYGISHDDDESPVIVRFDLHDLD